MTRAIFNWRFFLFFFSSFKATGCLDLTFDADCGSENDKTLSFSKKNLSPIQILGHNIMIRHAIMKLVESRL